MSGADEIFSSFRDPKLAAAAAAEQRQLVFEQGCVERILKAFGIAVNRRAAVEESLEVFGQRHLTFLWFSNTYPNFPATLASAKLRGTSGSKVGWTDLFGAQFNKLPWIVEYQQVVNGLGRDIEMDPVAMMFNAPHAAGAGTMVVHNLILPAPETADSVTRIYRQYKRPRVRYTIEPFGSFLAGMKDLWTPPD